MYQVVMRLAAPHDKHDELLSVLRGLIGPTEASKGCHGCRVYCDADEEDTVAYWMLWNERADMEEHFRSERFRKLLPYVELSTEPPVVEVSRLEVVGGMECILAAIDAQPE